MKIIKPEILETEAKDIQIKKEPAGTEPRPTFVPPKLEKHGDIGELTLFRLSP